MFFLIPIGQGQGLARWPWLTFGLIALNVLFFCLTGPALLFEWTELQQLQKEQDQFVRQLYGQYAEQAAGLTVPDFSEFKRRVDAGEIYPADSPERSQLRLVQNRIDCLKNGGALDLLTFNPATLRPWAFVTATFTHAGALHLLGNMLFLFLCAPPLEDRYGRLALAALYVAAGAVSHLGFALLHWGQDTTLVGASGAIAGLMGISLVRFPKVKVRIFYFVWVILRVHVGTFEAPLWLLLPIWLALQTVYLIFGMEHVNNVSYVSHVSGFAFGACVALAIKLRNIEQRLTPIEVKQILEDQEVKPALDEQQRASMCAHLLEVGRVQDALKEINQLRRERPNDPLIAGLLCKAQFAAGFKTDGREQARQALYPLLHGEDGAGCAALIEGLGPLLPELQLDQPTMYKLAALLERAQSFESAISIYQSIGLGKSGAMIASKALFAAARLCHEQLHDSERAARLCQELISRYPNALQAQQARALLERLP